MTIKLKKVSIKSLKRPAEKIWIGLFEIWAFQCRISNSGRLFLCLSPPIPLPAPSVPNTVNKESSPRNHHSSEKNRTLLGLLIYFALTITPILTIPSHHSQRFLIRPTTPRHSCSTAGDEPNHPVTPHTNSAHPSINPVTESPAYPYSQPPPPPSHTSNLTNWDHIPFPITRTNLQHFQSWLSITTRNTLPRQHY